MKAHSFIFGIVAGIRERRRVLIGRIADDERHALVRVRSGGQERERQYDDDDPNQHVRPTMNPN